MGESVTIKVNGETRTVDAPGDTHLLEVLRNDLGLTGAKYGCGEGRCGACTVLVNGVPARSCVTPVSTVVGAEVDTIEGLAEDDELHPLQQAFLEEGAMQCGYCVPGMIMGAVALLRNNPDPSEEQIVAHMNGNVCRCCGYPRMVEAIKKAAGAMREES